MKSNWAENSFDPLRPAVALFDGVAHGCLGMEFTRLWAAGKQVARTGTIPGFPDVALHGCRAHSTRRVWHRLGKGGC
jgi:hypothetical protein